MKAIGIYSLIFVFIIILTSCNKEEGDYREQFLGTYDVEITFQNENFAGHHPKLTTSYIESAVVTVNKHIRYDFYWCDEPENIEYKLDIVFDQELKEAFTFNANGDDCYTVFGYIHPIVFENGSLAYPEFCPELPLNYFQGHIGDEINIHYGEKRESLDPFGNYKWSFRIKGTKR